MWDILRKLALGLLAMPEKGETEPEPLFKWRIKVAFTIIILGGVELAFIVFAFGYLSFVGWSGFAQAADVQQLVRQGHETRVSQLERTIREDRTLQCQAIMEGNRSSMDYALEHLQADVNAYAAETKAALRIPDCGELIPSVPAATLNPVTPVPMPKAASAQ